MVVSSIPAVPAYADSVDGHEVSAAKAFEESLGEAAVDGSSDVQVGDAQNDAQDIQGEIRDPSESETDESQNPIDEGLVEGNSSLVDSQIESDSDRSESGADASDSDTGKDAGNISYSSDSSDSNQAASGDSNIPSDDKASAPSESGKSTEDAVDSSATSGDAADSQVTAWENVNYSFDNSEYKVHLEIIADNQELANQLQSAALRVKANDEIASLDQTRSLVESFYGETRSVLYLSIELINDSNSEINLAKGNIVKLSISSDNEANEILGILTNGSIKKYEQRFDENQLITSVEPENLGIFCVATPDEKQGGETVEEEQTASSDEIALYNAVTRAAAGTSNVEAPSSSVESLEPGTYTVTANLYVPAAANDILGINAYMTNPSSPFGGDGRIPSTPVTLNASLTIADDESRTATLELDVVNDTFKVMSIGGGSNAHILDIQRTGDTYTNESTGISYEGRINHIAVALDDLSGHYEFSDCVDMPPFGFNNWPLNLDIDFATISAPLATYTQSWTDEVTGVTLNVTTKDAKLGPKLEMASLVATQLSEGDAPYDAAISEMASWFYNTPNILGYTVALVLSDGSSLDLAGCDNVTVSIPNVYFGFEVFKLINESYERVESYASSETDRSNWYPADGLGTFFAITNYDTAAYAIEKTWTDPSGVSVTYHSTDQAGSSTLLNSEALENVGLRVYVDRDLTRENAVIDSAFSAPGTAGNSRFNNNIEGRTSFTADELANAEITVYRVGLYNTPDDSRGWGEANKSSLEVTVPVTSASDEVYAVIKTATKPHYNTWMKLDGRQYMSNGGRSVTFDMIPSSTGSGSSFFLYMSNSIKSDSFDDAMSQARVAYILVLHKNGSSVMVDKPVAAADLIYNGQEQVAVAENIGYTLEGVTKATKANAEDGTYTATATLNDGYIWTDGTTDPVTLEWTIAKKELTATYTGEQILAGETPQLTVTVDPAGFVDGENEANASGYVAPHVTAPASLEAGNSYDLTPECGAADNYAFNYVGGKLSVVASTSGLKAGTYSVSANIYVPGELNTQIPGVTAYLTNRNNPLGLEGGSGLPDVPVSYNATLVVKPNGKMYVTIPVVNPVFTLQGVDSGNGITVLGTTRDDKKYSTMSGNVSRQGRITMLYVQLTNDSGLYQLTNCTEFPTLLGVDWNVPLSVSVDFSSAMMQSTDTDVVIPGWTDPDPTPVNPEPEPDQPIQVVIPTVNNLTYNGKTQTGVAVSKAYTLTGATAKDAGTYEATATLNEGYVWSDGSKDAKTVTYTIAKAKLTATYAGETVVEGATPAYAVNVTGFVNGETVLTAEGFKAPSVSAVASGKLVAGESFELTPAGGAAKNYSYTYVAGTLKVVEPADTDAIAPGTYQITANLYVPGELNTVLGKNAYLTNASTPITDGNAPLTPVCDNAKLVVRADGSRVLVIPVVNPVFTLQSVSDGANVKVLGSVRGNDVTGSTQVKDRITELYVELGDDSGSYQLGACTEYPTLLEQQWNVPLRISADFSSLKKLSSTATITIPGQNKGDNGSNPGDNNQGSDNNGNQGNNGSADNNGTNGDQNNNGTNIDNSDGSYRLSAGTYTVTANIWLSDRSATGLPLMPYLTSGEFPPMNPVTGNATLTVDETGHATLYVPIVIQSKVMTVSGISGLDIIGVDYAGGYVSGVTVDLGTITDMSGVITRSCSATIVMGSLASTISGITGSHTWPATFQVVFTGVPVSGNAGSSYDWSKAATAAAGVGALAAEGTGASADMGFLAVATKAATQLAAHGAYGQAETSVAGNTAADFAAAGVSSSLSTLDPDEASGTDATAALALAASLSGGELSLSHTADAFDAKFLAA